MRHLEQFMLRPKKKKIEEEEGIGTYMVHNTYEYVHSYPEIELHVLLHMYGDADENITHRYARYAKRGHQIS